MEVQTEERRYLEDYLKYAGWGLYYKFVIGVACACHFTRGLTFVTIIYAVALSRCNEIYITENTALKIYTCYLFGSGIGGLITNSLSDKYGRNLYLKYSFICTFCASLTAAFAYNTVTVIGATLILGVGLETMAVQTRLLLIEILNKEARGSVVTFCNMFWALGCLITAFILFESPTILSIEKQPNAQLATWRIMFAASGGANLVLACVCALIEESPRYFLYTGRTYLALLLLRQLFAINNSSFADTFKVKEDDLRNLVQSYDLHYTDPDEYCKTFKKLLWRLRKSCQMMFSKGYCQITMVLMLLKIPLIVIGLIQLNLILAKQLIDTPTFTLNKYRGLDFIYPVPKPILYMSTDELQKTSLICQKNENNSIFYKNYLILGFVIILGHILSMFIVDRMGRKFLLFAGLILASCSCLLLGFIEQNEVQLIATCVIIASIAGVISTITLVNLESYPTAIRGTSNGLTSVPGYLLAVFYFNYIIIDRQIFTIILGIMYFCLSIFICFLPELKGKPMVE